MLGTTKLSGNTSNVSLAYRILQQLQMSSAQFDQAVTAVNRFLIHRRDEAYRIKKKSFGSDLGSLWKGFICCFDTLAVVCDVLQIEALYMNICSSQSRKNNVYKMMWQPSFLPFLLIKPKPIKKPRNTPKKQTKKKPQP